MLIRSHSLLFILLSCLSFSLIAMDSNKAATKEAAPGSLRKSQSLESTLTTSTKPEGSYTKTTQSLAFKCLFPHEVSLNSDYATQEISQTQIIEQLGSIAWTKVTTVTKDCDNKPKATIVEHFLDIRALEKIFVREILEKERPKIMDATRKQEQAKLSIIQRNPKKSLFIALCVGASLPFILPELYKQSGL